MSLTPPEALSKVLEDRVASTRITGARTLANMAAAGRIVSTTKTNIDWVAELGGESAGEGPVDQDTTATSGSDTTGANLRVGKYRIFHRINISRVDIQEASTVAPEDLANLFGESVDRGLNAIARKLNQRLWDGTGLAATAGIVGINKVLDEGAAYAGINPTEAGKETWRPILLSGKSVEVTLTAAYAAGTDYVLTFGDGYFVATIKGAGNAANTYAALADQINNTEKLQGRVTAVAEATKLTLKLHYDSLKPVGTALNVSAIVTVTRDMSQDLMLDLDEALGFFERGYTYVTMHPNLAKKYQKAYQTAAGNVAVINQAEGNGLKRADLGFGGKYFNGIPVVEESQAPKDAIVLMDMGQWSLYCFELSNTPADAISPIAINRSYGIPIHIAELPSSNSAIRTFEFYVMPQLRAFNRQGAIAIKDLK